MSRRRIPLDDMLAVLEREGLLAAGWRETLDARLGRAVAAPPWFVRGLVGFGAWLAAVLLISFIVGISVIATGGGYLVLGLVLMGGALVFRYRFDNDFASQLALAVSLAGQGLFAFSIVETSGFELEIEGTLVALAAINTVLLVAFPDRTHRMLSTVLAVGSVCGLLYALELTAVLPFVGPVLALVLYGLLRVEPMFAARGWLDAAASIRDGVLVAAFGCLMLSTIYVLPELVRGFVFYPRPWISTLLLGALLLWLVREVVDHVFRNASGALRAAAFGLTALVVAAALPAPGLILAVVVLVLGGIYGSRTYRGAGIAFVAVFTTAYFYGIDVGMLTKSASLVCAGLVVLSCRWLFLRFAGPGRRAPDPSSTEQSDA